MLRDGLNRQEVEGIRIILRLVCREFSIVLLDVSLSNLVIRVFIALTRYRFYSFIEADKALQAEYRDAVEYTAAKRLTEAMEEAYDFVIPDDEVIYYAMHLRIKQNWDEIPLTSGSEFSHAAILARAFGAPMMVQTGIPVDELAGKRFKGSVEAGEEGRLGRVILEVL
ncbi:PRD domain-containing protein [Enterocloster lavalensis]|nr:PRD domain-containing protein [Enterocloster lavalensis]